MKALTITKQGTPVAENVKFVNDWPEPTPLANEALVRTEASAMNHMDLWVGRGLPGLDLTYPRISGSDAAGIIEAVGDDVEPAWLGTRVMLNAQVPKPDPLRPDVTPAPDDRIMIGEHTNGGHAEKFIAPIDNLLPIGDSDPKEAVAIGLVHLTAWRMLISRAQLRAGQTVLITGIGGGVAHALLNIASHFGCTTIVTSRHQWKLDKAQQLGATHGVLDKGEDWSREVRNLTGKRGVDICADSIGKAVHVSCIKSLARGGTFVTCGATTGHNPPTDLARIFWNQLNIIGSTMGDMNELREVVALWRQGLIRPEIDRVFEAKDGADAYARLEAGEQFGKIVLAW